VRAIDREKSGCSLPISRPRHFQFPGRAFIVPNRFHQASMRNWHSLMSHDSEFFSPSLELASEPFHTAQDVLDIPLRPTLSQGHLAQVTP
jgi:hypothetical protein